MALQTVPIVTEDAALTKIPPIPIFVAKLDEVIACALASNHVHACDIDFEPVRPTREEELQRDPKSSSSPLVNDDSVSRVNKFTEGSFMWKAAKVKTHRDLPTSTFHIARGAPKSLRAST
jgi:hypothetical protein